MHQYTHNICSIPFEDYARDFQLIDNDTISVVVPCDDHSQALIEEIRQKGYAHR